MAQDSGSPNMGRDPSVGHGHEHNIDNSPDSVVASNGTYLF